MIFEKYNIVKKVRDTSPLIHHITNYVTVNDCANITLAFGASPIMAQSVEEVEEIVNISSGLIINIGTLQESQINSYLKAGLKAKNIGIPVIFDPVGCGASKLRSDTSKLIINEVRPNVIKGNMAEIKYLLSNECNIKGVDSQESMKDAQVIGKELALKTNAIVIVTGKKDYITDGDRTAIIHNGTQLLSRITGTGCMLNSIIASCCSVHNDYFISSIVAVVSMGICGEIAESNLKENEGTGTFKQRLIDAFSFISDQSLNNQGRIEFE